MHDNYHNPHSVLLFRISLISERRDWSLSVCINNSCLKQYYFSRVPFVKEKWQEDNGSLKE